MTANRYVFAGANPVNNVEDDGHKMLTGGSERESSHFMVRGRRGGRVVRNRSHNPQPRRYGVGASGGVLPERVSGGAPRLDVQPRRVTRVANANSAGRDGLATPMLGGYRTSALAPPPGTTGHDRCACRPHTAARGDAETAMTILTLPFGGGLGRGAWGAAKGVGALARATRGASHAAKGADDVARIKPGSAGGPTGGKRFPQEVRERALDENPFTCVFCRMPTRRPQVDHAIPRSRGGNATIDNAQTACPHCNPSKGARDFPVNPPPDYRGPWPPPWWRSR